jgi:hypothetical protein
VLNLAHKIKRWWNPGGSGHSALMPYEVECACGQQVTGPRLAVHQVVPCPRCGARLFIFPRSPLPFVSVLKGRSAPRFRSASPTRRRTWTLAAGAAAAVVLLAGLVLWVLPRKEKDTRGPPASGQADRPLGLETIRNDLAQGNFHSALAAARALSDQGPLSLAERRELAQLRRQAGLLADLLAVPLQEILRDAVEKMPPGEWPAVFARRYQDGAVVLDAELSRNAAGGLSLEYYLFVGRHRARVEIADLRLLKDLDVDRPIRVIVGARLAGISRERSGGWVVHLQPDSGVFLTDRGGLERACPDLARDRGLGEVLRRQRRWLKELP